MSKQERQDGARANTRDAKRRCEEEEEDRHARQNPQRRGRNKLNVWRSLMSLQILSTVPLGPKHARISVCVGARVCVCVCVPAPLKHRAVHNLSDSCQLCTPIYFASQIPCQQGPEPAGMTATETI